MSDPLSSVQQQQEQEQEQEQPWILPTPRSVQAENPEAPGYPSEPQNGLNVEDQMVCQAVLNGSTRQIMARSFQHYRAQLNSRNYDVSITSEPESENEQISFTVHKKKLAVPITVKNCGDTAVDFSLQAFDLVEDIFTIKDSHRNILQSIEKQTLKPRESFKITVDFKSSHAGFFEQLLVFKFKKHKPSSDEFEIMRLLEIRRLSSVSVKPSEEKLKSRHEEEAGVMMSDRRVKKLLRIKMPLKNYGMPQNVGDFPAAKRTLDAKLNWTNYLQRFQLLLHLEELQLQSDIDGYSQPSVSLFEYRNLFGLQIPGLSKLSSKKLCACHVLVTLFPQPNITSTTCYKGWVQYVRGELVFLKLEERPIKPEGLNFRVKFIINRIPMRVQHRAASLARRFQMEDILFPTDEYFPPNGEPGSELINHQGSNPEQFKAIQHIFATTAKPAPYLVFGPPGTGKTVTLVETIRQIVRNKACNILVCAPSNSATDHLCEKLCEIFDEREAKRKLYRLYALSCKAKNVPQNRKFSSNLNQFSVPFILPSKNMLMRYQILVTTLQSAARLVTGGIPPNFYSYIFVDEAGQATETECIIPIAGLLNKTTCQVVLAGDPKQLGPVITSRIASKYGLGVSLLERLMGGFDIYKAQKTKGFNSNFVTKLLRNYRSHPAILKVPNELFYEGELQPYASPDKCCAFCDWDYLPKRDFPVVFHGVAGCHEIDANCTSVYNTAEVEVLKKYLKALLTHLEKKGVTEIGPDEIGIITPYRKQVEKIQEALETDKDLIEKKIQNILVGTVEKFQGKESQVIMVSTVRSNPKMTEEQYRCTIGFVKDEKRFNVAMTRAQALLIVVGDPRALRTDPIWNKFIHYCYQEGGYRGITLSDPEESDQHPHTLREE